MTDGNVINSGGFPHLSRLVDSDDIWKHFRNFDKIFAEAKERLPGPEKRNESTAIARQLLEFAFQNLHLTLVFRFKSREIARGLNSAAADENSVVLFNLTRAFMEHTASLAYQDEALQAAVRDIDGKQRFDQLQSAIAKHTQTTERMYYGGDGSPVEAKRIHVSDLLRALARTYDRAEGDYACLCEFVHPNYGSNKLVSSGTLAAGPIGPQTDSLAAENRLACKIIARCAMVDSDLVMSHTASLAQLANWIAIASQDGAKLSQLALRGALRGDGKTKETAIFFFKARTNFEATRAFYKYIQEHGINLISRQHHGIEDGYTFDVCRTDRGNLWLKSKVFA